MAECSVFRVGRRIAFLVLLPHHGLRGSSREVSQVIRGILDRCGTRGIIRESMGAMVGG